MFENLESGRCQNSLSALLLVDIFSFIQQFKLVLFCIFIVLFFIVKQLINIVLCIAADIGLLTRDQVTHSRAIAGPDQACGRPGAHLRERPPFTIIPIA